MFTKGAFKSFEQKLFCGFSKKIKLSLLLFVVVGKSFKPKCLLSPQPNTSFFPSGAEKMPSLRTCSEWPILCTKVSNLVGGKDRAAMQPQKVVSL